VRHIKLGSVLAIYTASSAPLIDTMDRMQLISCHEVEDDLDTASSCRNNHPVRVEITPYPPASMEKYDAAPRTPRRLIVNQPRTGNIVSGGFSSRIRVDPRHSISALGEVITKVQRKSCAESTSSSGSHWRNQAIAFLHWFSRRGQLDFSNSLLLKT
jgi:hypothetical protein